MNFKIRKIKEYWESFIAGMENDLYGAQKKVGKFLITKNETNEFTTNSKVTIEERAFRACLRHALWTGALAGSV